MKKINLFLRYFFRLKFRADDLPSSQFKKIQNSIELYPYLVVGQQLIRCSWWNFAFGDSCWHFDIRSGELD